MSVIGGGGGDLSGCGHRRIIVTSGLSRKRPRHIKDAGKNDAGGEAIKGGPSISGGRAFLGLRLSGARGHASWIRMQSWEVPFCICPAVPEDQFAPESAPQPKRRMPTTPINNLLSTSKDYLGFYLNRQCERPHQCVHSQINSCDTAQTPKILGPTSSRPPTDASNQAQTPARPATKMQLDSCPRIVATAG